MRTLSIDIGGTGIKAICLDPVGAPVTERSRIETPHPATPDAVLEVLDQLIEAQGEFDRVSIGFPGVVMDGVTKTAPNLDPSWAGFPLVDALTKRTGKPTRCANDAGIQGLGVIEGRGLEMVITLGTGMGCGLYIDGRYVPNIELGHHPFKKKKTYEEHISNAERKRIGNSRWKKRVRKVIAQLEPVFNYRVLYVGGGNARLLDMKELPPNVRIVDNVAGLLGGIRLWEPAPATSSFDSSVLVVLGHESTSIIKSVDAPPDNETVSRESISS
jgi:polyphosphate glucokinase